MGLHSHRTFLIDEILKLSNIERTFLRKLKVTTLFSILNDLKERNEN